MGILIYSQYLISRQTLGDIITLWIQIGNID